jgi:hypothetical protein
MNADRFTDWLTLVPQLTWEQRRQVFLMLALAEADADEVEVAAEAGAPADEPTGLATRQSAAPGKPSPAVGPLAGYEATPDALAAAAQSRLARLDCPHCVRAKCAAGDRPAVCRATAAATVAGPSRL